MRVWAFTCCDGLFGRRSWIPPRASVRVLCSRFSNLPTWRRFSRLMYWKANLFPFHYKGLHGKLCVKTKLLYVLSWVSSPRHLLVEANCNNIANFMKQCRNRQSLSIKNAAFRQDSRRSNKQQADSNTQEAICVRWYHIAFRSIHKQPNCQFVNTSANEMITVSRTFHNSALLFCRLLRCAAHKVAHWMTQ